MKRHCSRFAAALLAGAALALLAGCSEDKPVQAPAENPPATSERPNDGPGESAGRSLDEATKALREEAARVGEKAREAASEALKNAGPLLEKAGEAAARIGQSANEILEKAAADLNRAIEALEKSEGQSALPHETGDPAATLAPADRLKADTRAAARASAANVGPEYVGVWAGDAASCARVDQEPVELFAVVTPTTIRRYESVCNFTPGETTGNTTVVAASCIAEGETEDRSLSLTLDEPDRLAVATDGSPATPLVRCHLP